MIKIVFIAILIAVIIIYLRQTNSELALLATIAGGIILLSFVLEYITQTFDIINQLILATNLDKSLFKIIFKITAIGYLVEFSASIIKDFGLNSLSDKLIFIGKIIIVTMSMPIIYAVFNLLKGILQ